MRLSNSTIESSSFGAVAEQPPAAEASGEYAELYSSVWVAHLRAKLADECLRLGLQDLDASVIQRALSLGASRSSLPARPTKRLCRHLLSLAVWSRSGELGHFRTISDPSRRVPCDLPRRRELPESSRYSWFEAQHHVREHLLHEQRLCFTD